jgi:hypothetical protein
MSISSSELHLQGRIVMTNNGKGKVLPRTGHEGPEGE